MIISQITSGLGNQLFEYAFAKHLSIFNNTSLYFDLSFYKSTYTKGTQRAFKLDKFNIKYKLLDEGFLLYLIKATRVLPSKSLKPLFIYLKENQYHFNHEDFNTKAKNIYIQGYWTSEKYFSQIADSIREDLKFNYPVGENFEFYKKEIVNAEIPVSIHIRRGDYVHHPAFSKSFGFIGLDYYTRAIKIVESKASHCRFFIFTDDQEWVKNNFNRDYVLVNNKGENADLDDLQLMSLCKHNIIANSTFSWWGAWLNANKDKVIIAPEKWFKNQPNWDTKDLIPETWIKV